MNQKENCINAYSVRERRLQASHKKAIHNETLTLHPGTLRALELEAEEYVFALIKETNPLRYLGSLLRSWLSDASSMRFHHRPPMNTPSVESSADSASCRLRLSWAALCSIIVLKTLLFFAKPFEILGNTLEYCLNLVYSNQGLRQTLHRCVFNQDALRKPHQEDEDYYCLTGLLDPRQELCLQEGILSDVTNLGSDAGMKGMADVCVMSSKLSYENENVIKKVVEQVWKMNFVEYFDCWNEYLESKATQAFIFTDKKQEANVVVVAFRGTQPFNMQDWCTDFDFSYYVLPEIGRVHVGFLEALGLGNRLRKETLKQAKLNTIMKATGQTPMATPTSGLPERVINDNDKVLAYDAICAKLRVVLRQNLGAKLYITGHSLGGALASLFTGLLLFEGNEACFSLGGVFTFGQPRVGDAKFASYMEKKLCGPNGRKYFRVVYRTDIVTRVPFDDHLFQFKHISPCHYYSSCCSESKALLEEPHKDLLVLVLLPNPHLSAIREFLESLGRRLQRKDEDGYAETGLCLVMRFCAMLTPGICAHSPSCYVDAVRGATSSFLQPAAR